LIIAHKADLLKTGTGTTQQDSVAINRVKTILERELEKRKAAQSSGIGVEGLGDEGEKTELGGLDCRDGTGPFKFDDWEGGDVSFVSTFMRGKAPTEDEKNGDKDGLSELRDWLTDNM
jgi:signal recognition particle receptor subunit beta